MRARRRKQPRDAVGGFDESSKCGGWHGAHTDGRRQRKGAAFDSGVALHRFVSGSSEVEGKWHRSCRFTARDQNPIQFSRNRENRRRFAASSPRVPSSSRGYGRRLRDDHFRPAFGVGTLTLPPLKPTSFVFHSTRRANCHAQRGEYEPEHEGIKATVATIYADGRRSIFEYATSYNDVIAAVTGSDTRVQSTRCQLNRGPVYSPC